MVRAWPFFGLMLGAIAWACSGAPAPTLSDQGDGAAADDGGSTALSDALAPTQDGADAGGAGDATLDPSQDPRVRDLLAYAANRIAVDHVPGLGLALVVNGTLYYAGGVGVKKAGAPELIDAGTRFRAASLSKMVLAATMMTLVDEGKVDLSHPVTDYLPSFALQAPFDPSTITVADLLDHTSAIPDVIVENCPPSTTLAGWIAANPQPLWATPGTFYNYSNLGFSVAGLLIQTVTGQPYDEAATFRILGPSGMVTATFDPHAATTGDHAVGHIIKRDGTLVSTTEPDGYDCAQIHPSGGVLATPSDYAHFAEMLLANGANVLTPQAIATMTGAHVDTKLYPNEGYGLGIEMKKYADGPVVELFHNGSLPGYLSTIKIMPSEKFAAIAMINARGSGWSGSELPGTAHDVVDHAIEVFVKPQHGTPPTLKTQASTWASAYDGTYVDPFGTLGTITVQATSTQLIATPPAFEDGGAPAPMVQDAIDAWHFADGLSATFERDDGGTATYLVTRAGIGVRQ
jgi:CubicO group peptidase (beta-lactamase class C family)